MRRGSANGNRTLYVGSRQVPAVTENLDFTKDSALFVPGRSPAIPAVSGQSVRRLLDEIVPDRSVLCVPPYIGVFGLGHPLNGLDVMRRQRMLSGTDHGKADVPRVRQ